MGANHRATAEKMKEVRNKRLESQTNKRKTRDNAHVLVEIDALLHVHDQQRHLADGISPVGGLGYLKAVAVGVFDAQDFFLHVLPHRLIGNDARAQGDLLPERKPKQDRPQRDQIKLCIRVTLDIFRGTELLRLMEAINPPCDGVPSRYRS